MECRKNKTQNYLGRNIPTQGKTFKAIYYWESGLKQLLNEAPDGYMKRCIQDRLSNFSVTVKNLNVVGWSYSKEITPDTIHRYDVDALEKALQEEKVFVDICKPLIFNQYKRMGIESVKTTYQKIEKMIDMIETYRRENDGKKVITNLNVVSKGKDTPDVIHSYLKIIGTGLGLIAASATALKAYNDIKEMTKKK